MLVAFYFLLSTLFYFPLTYFPINNPIKITRYSCPHTATKMDRICACQPTGTMSPYHSVSMVTKV